MSTLNQPPSETLVWRNRFASLGETFFTHLSPSPLPAPYWISHNPLLLSELGWPTQGLSSPDALLAFSGCAIPEGAVPLASVYSGHQFGSLNNADSNGYSYTGVSKFCVVDMRVVYKVDRQWTVAGGIDNLNNYKYWNYHLYPMRTFFAELKYDVR